MAALQYVHVGGYSAIIFRKTFTDLQLAGALIDRSKQWLMGTDAKWNGETMTWTFPSSAKIQFGYMANPDDHYRYQGPEYQFVGFDELTHFREEQYTYMFSRMRRLKDSEVPLRMRAASNPGGFGHDWVKHRFITSPADRRFIPAKIVDNPYLDQESYIGSLMNLLPTERERLLQGNWDATDDRLVSYEDMMSCTANTLWGKGGIPQNSKPELYIGIDIGRTRDLTAIWTWQRIGDVAWCRECFTMQGASYGEQKDEIRKRITRYVVKCCIDKGGIGNDLAEEMERAFPIQVEGVQLSTGRMGQLGQSLALACAEKKIRIPNDDEIRNDWRKVRKVDTSRDVPRLETDRDRSGHGDRFWAAALGFWPLHTVLQRPVVRARLPQSVR